MNNIEIKELIGLIRERITIKKLPAKKLMKWMDFKKDLIKAGDKYSETLTELFKAYDIKPVNNMYQVDKEHKHHDEIVAKVNEMAVMDVKIKKIDWLSIEELHKMCHDDITDGEFEVICTMLK